MNYSDPSGCSEVYYWEVELQKITAGINYVLKRLAAGEKWKMSFLHDLALQREFIESQLEAAKLAEKAPPLADIIITAGYPYYPDGTSHRGVDMSADEGTVVNNVSYGEVIEVSTKIDYNTFEDFTITGVNTYGIYAKVLCGDVVMIYAHLSSVNVSEGQIVLPWDTIGFSGNTGRSSGPHLHFEINDANTGRTLSPYGYIS